MAGAWAAPAAAQSLGLHAAANPAHRTARGQGGTLRRWLPPKQIRNARCRKLDYLTHAPSTITFIRITAGLPPSVGRSQTFA